MLHRQLLDRMSARHGRGRWGSAQLRALIALGAVTALHLAAPTVSSVHADAAQVTVVSPGGAQQTLSLDALAGGEDVVDRTYALRGPEGESSRTITGFSLAMILEAAGADPYGFSYLGAQRPAGGAVLLSRHQALDPGAFADGPPVVYASAGGTGFLRPSSGTDDPNEADSFEAPQGVTVVLRKGSPLRVRAQASTLRTEPGEAVAFTAVVDRAGSGEQLSYSWYFDDGHSANGAGVRHRFAKRGSYDVVVGVTTPGDDAGASAVVTVQVGAPLGGPDRKGGGTNEDADAPDHGAATGAGTRAPGAGAGSPATASAPPAAPDRRARRQQAKPESPDGEQVSGLLLTSASTSPAKPPTAVAARTGKLDEQGSGAGLPGAALGLLVTAGLLGLGALAEARGSLLKPFATKEPRL
jgi:PKD domain